MSQGECAEPWRTLAQEALGPKAEVVPPLDDGALEQEGAQKTLDDVRELLRRRPCTLVA